MGRLVIVGKLGLDLSEQARMGLSIRHNWEIVHGGSTENRYETVKSDHKSLEFV